MSHASIAIKSLLTQSIQPLATVLWVTREDATRLPKSLLRLRPFGLQIHVSDTDYRSATKLIPNLLYWPDKAVATADDDCIYEVDWLADLVELSASFPGAIVAHRTHLVSFDGQGRPRPYSDWEFETLLAGPSRRHFFTGAGGVLYPPRSLHELVMDNALRSEICPTADDVWFNCMARLRGTEIVRTSGRPNRLILARHAALDSLATVNVVEDANTEQMRAMASRFGQLF